MILPNDFAKTVEKSDKGEEKHGRRKQYEKDGYNSFLALRWYLHWLAVEIMLKVQMRTMQNTKKAIPLATRPAIMTEKSKQPEMKSILHSFRVLLWPQLSNSCPITMRFREKQSPLFTSFRTGLFCFISRRT